MQSVKQIMWDYILIRPICLSCAEPLLHWSVIHNHSGDLSDMLGVAVYWYILECQTIWIQIMPDLGSNCLQSLSADDTSKH